MHAVPCSLQPWNFHTVIRCGTRVIQGFKAGSRRLAVEIPLADESPASVRFLYISVCLAIVVIVLRCMVNMQ